jgi:hypothetical protein
MPSSLHKIALASSIVWGILHLAGFGYKWCARSVAGFTIGELLYDSIHYFIHFGGHIKTWGWL